MDVDVDGAKDETTRTWLSYYRPGLSLFARGLRGTSSGVLSGAANGTLHLAPFLHLEMASKQKRDNDKPLVQCVDALRMLLFANVLSHKSAEIAILHLMKSYDFSLGLLQQVLTGRSNLFWN